MAFDRDPSVNVLGGPLAACSAEPMTGFFRNGACDTCAEDRGSHTVCAVMTAEFLAYSKRSTLPRRIAGRSTSFRSPS